MLLVHNECLHEERILSQTKAIERLNAELGYKKEKLDDLKNDNKRMEEKIDDIRDCLNDIIIKSKTDDEKLERRLIAIETRQQVQDELIQKNREDFNIKLTVISVIFGAVTLVIGVLAFYFTYVR